MIPRGTTVEIVHGPDGPYARFLRGGEEFTPSDYELPSQIEQAVAYGPGGDLIVVVNRLGAAAKAALSRISLQGARLWSGLLGGFPCK